MFGGKGDHLHMVKHSSHQSAMSIGALVTNYWRAGKRPIERKKKAWSCPAEGIIKINVDIAYDVDEGKGGMGAVARDNKGKFMIACCKEIHFVADSFMAEAYALREGLSLAQYLGSNKLVI